MGKGDILKLLPRVLNSIRAFIRAIEVYMGHFLYEFFYDHAYEHIDIIYPHKYWIPTLFLVMCMAVHQVRHAESSLFTLDKLVLSCDPATITIADFRRLQLDHVRPAPIPVPEKSVAVLLQEEQDEAAANPPKWYTYIARFSLLFGVLFGGLIIQHVLITLGLVHMTEPGYESAADKFSYLEDYGMNIESIFSFFVGQIVSNAFYDQIKVVIGENSRKNLVKSSSFQLMRPLFFALAFYLVRRVFRNLNSTVLSSFDSVPLFIMVLVVSFPYILRGTMVKQTLLVYFEHFGNLIVHLASLIFDNFNTFCISSLFILFAYTFTVPSRSNNQESVKENPVLRAVKLVPAVAIYGAQWTFFHLRFDWWFGAGLGLSMMRASEFPDFLFATALPVFQSFRDLCWWFPFFDTSREMAFATKRPVW